MLEEEETKAPQKTCSFFKKSNRRGGGGARKRQKEESSDEDDSDEESAVIRKEKAQKKSLLTTTSSLSSKNKIAKTSKKNGDNDSNDEEEEEKAKKLKSIFTYESSRTQESEGPTDGGATATLETETLHDRDARAIFERSKAMNETLKGKKSDNLYRGQNNYTKYVEARDSAQMNAANKKGPIRAPTFLRATTRWDYQPDICKDYKETGTCGFGDTCKFLHDRGDYKSGWELEKEWENSKEEITEFEINDDDEADDLPFACYICRGDFKDPIVTRCRHYFCESCALNQYRQTTRCAVCNRNTGGIFNPAKEMVAKLSKAEQSKVRIKDPDEDL